jgi:hypothetical protein
MRCIDIPIFVPDEEYSLLTDKIVSKFKSADEVLAIYQLGSVSTPGISDLDLLFIFKEDIYFKPDVKKGLNDISNYILIHNPYGATVKYLKESVGRTFYNNFKVLYSEISLNELPDKIYNLRIIKQECIEYLLKFYINFSTQMGIKILKVRNLLLEIKALKQDLDILGFTDHKIYYLIEENISIRNNWYQSSNSMNAFLNNVTDLHKCLDDFMKEVFSKYCFVFPNETDFRFSRNYGLIRDNNFFLRSRKRLFIPGQFIFNNKKYFNLLNRFICHELHLPWIFEFVGNEDIMDKINYDISHTEYNSIHFRNFLPLKGPLINSSNYNNINFTKKTLTGERDLATFN